MQNKKVQFPAAAIFYVLLALDLVIDLTSLMASPFFSTARLITYAIELTAYLFIAIVLFAKRRNILTVIAAAIPIVLSVVSFNPITLVINALLLAIVACCVFSKKETAPGFAKYMWFVPGLLAYVYYLYIPVYSFMMNIKLGNTAADIINNPALMSSFYFSFFYAFLQAIALLLFAAWVVFPYTKSTVSSDENNNAAPARDGYINIGLHAVLLLVTCGVWQLVWIYKTTKTLNGTVGMKDRSPIAAVLLSIFIPFYYWCWIYQSAKRIDRKTATGNTAGICLLLAILVGIVSPIVIQTNINSIAAAPAAVQEA